MKMLYDFLNVKFCIISYVAYVHEWVHRCAWMEPMKMNSKRGSEMKKSMWTHEYHESYRPVLTENVQDREIRTS